MINTERASTRVLETDHAEEIVRKILSVLKNDLSNVTLYEVPTRDLVKKQEDLETPSPSWAIDLGYFRDSECMDNVDENSEAQRVYKGVPKAESLRREQVVDDTTTNADFDDEHHPLEESKDYTTQSNLSQELNFDSDDSDVGRNTNECMLTKESLNSFTLLKVIGKGAFGRVFLAKKDNGEVFAMKRIRKDKVLRSNAVENILLERKILSEVKHPLLLNLKHVFASKYRFYFFCDYIVGGDLMRHLAKKQNGFTIAEIKFLASQLVLALECLHSNSIVHRDLKPENVLIDDEGYLRLADFGLAKDLSEQAGKGFCGTLEYMAPEIVSNSEKGHNYTVDWWTLGVIMYELYYGKTPFIDETREAVLHNIVSKEVEFPDKPGEESIKGFKHFKSVVKKLLIKNPDERLGYNDKGSGAKKVKKNSFFKNVDWEKILNRDYEAPYIPAINVEKIKKYLQRKGCKIGVLRKKNDANGKLAETDIPTKVKKAVRHFNKRFEEN